MKFLTRTRFELRGEFGGFVRTAKGKRRLLLRVSGDELRLKVPKLLRRQIGATLGPGSEIEVFGFELRDRLTERIKREVARFQVINARPPIEAPRGLCKIRVCTKANCWEQGGRELWRALEQKLQDADLTEQVEVKGVRCLGRCKLAPNLAFHREYHERCQLSSLDPLVLKVSAEILAPLRTKKEIGLQGTGKE
jgi:hypothetical protein